MKKLLILAALLCTALYFCGHSSVHDRVEAEGPRLNKLDDLNSPEFRVGVPLGGKSMSVGEDQFSRARLCYFNNPRTAYDAILQRKADAFLFSSHSLDFIDSRHEDLTVLPGCLDRVDIAIAFTPEQGNLRAEVNHFINLFKNDGTYEDMYNRWFKSRKLPRMPYIEKPARPKRTIRVGTCSQVAPLCFRVGEEELSGFDIELLQRLALHLNAHIILYDMDFPELFAALDDSRIDMALAGLNKDTTRPDKVIYSKSYIDSYIVAIVHNDLVKKAEEK